MTQGEFAARFRLSLATVRDWEQGRTRPHLDVIARNPQMVMQTLGTEIASVAQR